MLNKKRLAALGLSAVMVASTASLPVSAADFSDGSNVVSDESADFGVAAADVEVNDDAQDVVGEEVNANSFKGTYNPATGKIDYAFGDKMLSADATSTEKEEATCDKDGYIIYKGVAENNGTVTATVDISKEEVRREHSKATNPVVRERVNEETCEIETITVEHCSTCGVDYLTKDSKWDGSGKFNHDIRNGKTTYEKGENTKYVEGDKDHVKEPQLVDITKNGSYTKITTGFCEKCEKNVQQKDVVNVPAKGDAEVTSVKITSWVNIDVERTKKYFDIDIENSVYTDKDLPKNEDIVLENCAEDGSYVVTTYYNDDTNDGGVTVTVPAHHVYWDAVYNKAKDNFDKKICKLVALNDAGKADESLNKYLTPVWNDAGTKVVDVINSNCAKDIKYKITSTCVSNPEKHLTEREGVAAKSTTNHVLDAKADTFKKTVENVLAGKQTKLTNSDLVAISGNTNVKITPETATCVKSGTVTVEIYCQLCGTKVASFNGVKSDKLDHYIKEYSKENVVAPTCVKNGSYEQVEKCKICGEEIRRDTVVTRALGHTNDKGDVKGAEVYIKMYGDRLIPRKTDIKVGQEFVGAEAFMLGDPKEGINGQIVTRVLTNCATCHDNEQKLEDGTGTTKDKLKIVVTSIKNAVYRQTTEDGKLVDKMVTPGTIDLKVTYTRTTGETVTTETSFLYGNKIGVAFPDEYKSGLEKDADGVYRYYKDGQFDATYVGFAELDGEQFFVNKGLIEKSTGLKLHEGKWYNLAEGRLTAEYTGAILYDGSWFYVTNGVMNTSKSGLADYNGGTFLFTDGRLRNDVNGLWLDPTTGIWYFLSNGQVQTQHTGVAMYDGAFFYIQGGQLAKNYKGTVKYDGHTFNVVEGQLYGPIK